MGPTASVFHSGFIDVVDRDEGRLAADGEPDVVRIEQLVDLMAESVDLLPLLLGIGLGDARRFVDAVDRHMEAELDLGRLDHAGDRRGVDVMGRGGERHMPFAGHEPRGRIEADPAGAGQIDLGPGMQIGEILLRPRGAVQRLHIGRELDQIAGDEARGEAEIAQDLHQQPGGIAARALRPRLSVSSQVWTPASMRMT